MVGIASSGSPADCWGVSDSPAAESKNLIKTFLISSHGLLCYPSSTMITPNEKWTDIAQYGTKSTLKLEGEGLSWLKFQLAMNLGPYQELSPQTYAILNIDSGRTDTAISKHMGGVQTYMHIPYVRCGVCVCTCINNPYLQLPLPCPVPPARGL